MIIPRLLTRDVLNVVSRSVCLFMRSTRVMGRDPLFSVRPAGTVPPFPACSNCDSLPIASFHLLPALTPHSATPAGTSTKRSMEQRSNVHEKRPEWGGGTTDV